MAHQIASFKKDWSRWTHAERLIALILLAAVAVAPLTASLL
jgi:hypothetical protein